MSYNIFKSISVILLDFSLLSELPFVFSYLSRKEMPGIKHTIIGLAPRYMDGKYLNALSHSMMKKIIGILYLVKNKNLFFLYNISFCLGLIFRTSKSCWRWMRIKSWYRKVSWVQLFFLKCRRVLLWKMKQNLKRWNQEVTLHWL